MKHSNVYYILEKDGTYKPCEKATGVRNPYGIDIFRHMGMISDGKTGCGICSESEWPAVLKNRITIKEQYEALLQKSIERFGLSPRYTQPEVRHEQLYPRDENRVLSRECGSKTRHYFYRLSTLENGLELFQKESEMIRGIESQMLYARLNGWMVCLDKMTRKDITYQTLRSSGFDLHQMLLDNFEAMLADPQRWADFGLADLFDRRAEAETHNQPIRDAREAERQRDRAARDEAEAEREQRQQEAYQAAITEAQQKLVIGEVVQNIEIIGSSLVLQLFRENNVAVPLRTQGWIISSLVSIQWNGDDGLSYRYRGSKSSAIYRLIEELVKVLEHKHQENDVVEKQLAQERKNTKNPQAIP